MPHPVRRTTNQLTEKEHAFVENILEGFDPVKAAKMAGYASPAQSVAYIRQRGHVADAIANAIATEARGRYPAKIMKFAADIMGDNNALRRDRISAAELLRKCCNSFAPPVADSAGSGHELSIEELDRHIKAATQALERMNAEGDTIEAQVVDVTPQGQAGDLLAD